MGSGALFVSMGVIVSEGVIVSDGVIIGDGVIVSDLASITDGVIAYDVLQRSQSAQVNGDPTASCEPIADAGVY